MFRWLNSIIMKIWISAGKTIIAFLLYNSPNLTPGENYFDNSERNFSVSRLLNADR